jgi:hypothetical protein
MHPAFKYKVLQRASTTLHLKMILKVPVTASVSAAVPAPQQYMFGAM